MMVHRLCHSRWLGTAFAATIFAFATASVLAQAPVSSAPGKRVVPNRIDQFERDPAAAKSAAFAWPRYAKAIRAAMQEAMGQLPERPATDRRESFREFANRTKLAIDETVDFEGYRRVKLTFEVEPNDRLPCYLLVPTGADVVRPGPAILALHQTTNYGKAEVADERIDAKISRPNMRYGVELARRGYVVIAPDYPSFGDYRYDFSKSMHVSGTMKGIFNHMQCVDLLRTRPEVDPDRIGAIGHSLGGHNSIFVAAFDDRIKAVVSCCGWCPFREYYDGNIKGWTSDRYMPRLKTVYGLDVNRVPFEFDEVVACLAPRAFLSISPVRDANFSVVGVKRGLASAARAYDALEAKSKLQALYPDYEHDFPPDMREAAYQFLDDHLVRVSKPR